MTGIIATILSFLLLYGYWAIFVIFFVSAVIVPIPTSTVLLAIGAFASQGYFSFFISFALIIFSNCLGDVADYFLARRYGKHILEIFHVHKLSLLVRLEAFLRQYPRSLIFFTRFSGTTDSLVNLLAGYGGIPFSTFIMYDVIGNIISNGILLYAGYFFGANWQDFTGFFNLTDYIVLGVAVAGAISIVIWRKHRANAVSN